MLSIFKYFSLGQIQAAGKPYAASPVRHEEKPDRPSNSLVQRVFGSRTVPDLGNVTTSIAHVTDASLVERTWGLLSVTPSRKDEFYGPKFTWVEYFKVRSWLHGVAIHWGLLLGGFLIACVPPVRSLIKMFIYQPGQGPERDVMHKESVEYRGVAKPDRETKNNERAFVTATYKGSMYYRKWEILTWGPEGYSLLTVHSHRAVSCARSVDDPRR